MNPIRASRAVAATLFLIAAALGASLFFAPERNLLFVGPWGVDVGLTFDVLSTVLLAFVASVVWIVTTYAIRNFTGQQRTNRFGYLMLAATAALTLLVAGASLPMIAVGWTASGLALAALVNHTDSPSARVASRLVRRRLLVSDAFIWSGVVAAMLVLPSTNRSELASQPLSLVAATGVAALLAGAAIARSGLVPLHSWLPETAEAPSPVSAFLHAGIVNGAGIIGALAWPIFRASPITLAALIVIGAMTVAIGTWSARVRSDVKGQLASSTTAQMGYMTVQLGLGLPAAAIAHLIGHGYYKAWLFLRAGGAVSRSRLRSGSSPASKLRGRSVAPYLGGLAALVGSVLMAPALRESVSELGLTAALPGLLALATVAVAVTAATRVAGIRATTAALVTVIGGLAAGAYQWALFGWESLLAGSLPLTQVWGGLAAVGWLAALVAAGAVVVWGARSITSNPGGLLSVSLSSTVLAPGLRSWPTASREAADWVATQTTDSGDVGLAVELVKTSSATCAPSWPLRTMVASNPLAGLEGFDFGEAAAIAERTRGASSYLSITEYLNLFEQGSITTEGLAHAVGELRGRSVGAAGTSVDDEVAAIIRRARSRHHDAHHRSRSAEYVAQPVSSTPDDLVLPLEHAAAWSARAWSSTSSSTSGPWELWRAAAAHPAYDRAVSAPGVSAIVGGLPTDPARALHQLLELTGLRGSELFGYVTQLQTAAPGWTSHAHWRARELDDPMPLVELVTLRCALDLLINGVHAPARRLHNQDATTVLTTGDGQSADFDDREMWQRALEYHYRAGLLGDLAERVAVSGASKQVLESPRSDSVTAQLIFCIDVRSERFRRALESGGDRYQTFGFAGFFGAAIRYEPGPGMAFDQCPVLIKPTRVIRENSGDSTRLADVLHTATIAVSGAPITALLIAESGGLLSGIASVCQTVTPTTWRRLATRWGAEAKTWGRQETASTSAAPHDESSGLPVGLSLDDRAALASSSLRAIGLVSGFAPLIVVCGHGSTTENNAFATGYDCGACGGNTGAVNARVLADAINDPQVRERLRSEGIDIPASSVAIAALHNTTTDTVSLDPNAALPASHEACSEQLRTDLERAGSDVRRERLPLLPGAANPSKERTSLSVAESRGADWSQPIPEWGLAGNAAFVIGPRSMTKNLDLEGRVFLHSYDPSLDETNAVLELLLTAPGVVTQWINSQYYFSTVDPANFGAGDKTTHNVVGDVGVLSGAHGDLRIGLPWQAIYSGDPRTGNAAWAHQPLRLLIVAYARPDKISQVLSDHPAVAQLFANGWARLACIDPGTSDTLLLDQTLAWVPWRASEGVSSIDIRAEVHA